MENKPIALITEAGNGLSSKFATILNGCGYEVIIAANENSHSQIAHQQPKGIKLLKADFTQIGDVVNVYAHMKTHYGKLDVLINNAEIANGFGQKITELNLQEVKHLFDENLFSIMELTKALLPLLKRAPLPRIINITSSLGSLEKMQDNDFHYSDYRMTAYSMAKSALDMFTVLLSRELRETKIKVEGFDPIRIKNCTHNNVTICSGVEKELLQILERG